MIRYISRIIAAGLLLQVTFVADIIAQNEVKVRTSEFKIKKEGFSEAYKNIKKGNSLIDEGKGGFTEALGYYLKAYAYNDSNTELNYKIGMAYLRSAPKDKSLPYLETAFRKNPKLTKDIQFQLAKAYQYSLKFDHAFDQFDAYFKSLKRKHQKKQLEIVDKSKDECKIGKELLLQPKRAVINNVGESVNSIYDDYNAIVISDSIMYFTSRRPLKNKEKPKGENYMFDEDIFTSYSKDGEWTKAKYLEDNDFNSKGNEDIVWVSEDGKTRYFYDGRSGGDIFVSTFKKGEWTDPDKIARKFNSDDMESSVSVTRDGNTIYFVSSNSDETIGGKDIFVSQKDKKGKWEKPRNLGLTINTKTDEEWVYVSPDNRVLYFSSKGHQSMGGYDIYRSERNEYGQWSKPENIGFPVNSPDDELFYRPAENERSAYFASRRNDTYGGFDLYKVLYLGKEKKMQLATEQQLVAYFYKPISDIFARISGEEKIDTIYYMVGSITDKKRKTPIMAKIDLIDIEASQVISTTMSDSTGNYRAKLPKLKKYGIEIHAKDYMLYLDVVNIPPKIEGKDFTQNFVLAKVEAGTKIVLKNIYFETGKAVLTPESNIELDKVVKFLLENTDIKVEISGHTDNIGVPAANLRLSESRAKAVVGYMVKQGINQEKLVYKGYGSTQPIAPNNKVAGRKLNRRVEFKILSVE